MRSFRLFVRSFELFVCWLVCSFVRSFVCLLVNSLVRLFVLSFVSLFVLSFVRSFVYQSIIRKYRKKLTSAYLPLFSERLEFSWLRVPRKHTQGRYSLKLRRQGECQEVIPTHPLGVFVRRNVLGV